MAVSWMWWGHLWRPGAPGNCLTMWDRQLSLAGGSLGQGIVFVLESHPSENLLMAAGMGVPNATHTKPALGVRGAPLPEALLRNSSIRACPGLHGFCPTSFLLPALALVSSPPAPASCLGPLVAVPRSQTWNYSSHLPQGAPEAPPSSSPSFLSLPGLLWHLIPL